MICNSCRTLQQCLQQKRRNASLQQVYNSRKTVRMGGLSLCHYSHSIVAGGLLEMS